MPCRCDDMDPVIAKKGLDFEAILCGVLTELEMDPADFDALLSEVDWKEVGHTFSQVMAWWDHHKKEDEIRRQREAETARLQHAKDLRDYERLKKKLGK